MAALVAVLIICNQPSVSPNDFRWIFLLNSKISDTIFLKVSLFDINVWFYIFVGCAVLGIVFAWCYKRLARC